MTDTPGPAGAPGPRPQSPVPGDEARRHRTGEPAPLRSGSRSVAAGWAALVVVWLVWGSTYLAIRVGVEAIPPLLLAAVRYLAAGAILYPLAVRSGGAGARAADQPRLGGWMACAITGILLLSGGNGGVSLGERTVASGLASLLVASVPLWLLLLDSVLNRARIRLVPLAGLIAGLAGVALLARPGSGTGGGAGTGVVVILAASVSWALGTILSRGFAGTGQRLGPLTLAAPARPLLATAMQMITGGAVLLALATATGEVAAFHPAGVPLRCWLALIYLIGPGSIIALSAYVIAVRSLPTATVATYAYVNPVVAVTLGTLLLGEPVTRGIAAGGGLIIVAVAAVATTRTSAAH